MNWLTVVRDVLIILVALESLVAIGFLVYVVFQILALVRTIRAQVPPLLTTAKTTAGTVEGTVAFVSRRAVIPVVRGVSIAAAIVRFLQVLFRGSHRRTRRP